MKLISAFSGAVLGLILFGVVVAVAVEAGLPSGLGWWVGGVPFVGLMAYLAAIQN